MGISGYIITFCAFLQNDVENIHLMCYNIKCEKNTQAAIGFVIYFSEIE